jgi:hypothetical protein
MGKRRKKSGGARRSKSKDARTRVVVSGAAFVKDDNPAASTRRPRRARGASTGGRSRRRLIPERVDETSFDAIVRLGLLDPRDPLHNAVLAAAGARYRSLWREAGRWASVAPGTPAVGVQESAFAGKSLSAGQAARRDEYRRAREKLPAEQRGVLDEVLLAEGDLATAGRNASGRQEESQAVVVATDRLACGCAILARHFGLLPPR